MPEVVCNTSPLQYLHQLDQLDLLRKMYGSILVPPAVASELSAGRTRGVSLPDPSVLDWMEVRASGQEGLLRAVTDLGAGEREVLALAATLEDPLVVLDDGLGRRYARLMTLPTTGTLGVLIKAKRRGHLEVITPLLEQLTRLGFWLDPATRMIALREAGED